jgi:hypothetical protein
VFIDYAEGSKAYCILDLGTQCVHMTRDVVFNEGRGWTWDKVVDDGSTPTYDNFTVEYIHFEGARGVDNSLSPSMSTLVDNGHDLGCNEVFATTTTAGDPMHSSSDSHPSGHVHSDTSSCQEPNGVRYSALP